MSHQFKNACNWLAVNFRPKAGSGTKASRLSVRHVASPMAHSTTGGLPLPLTCAVRAWPGGLFLFSPFPPSPFFFSLLGEMGQVGGVQRSRVLAGFSPSHFRRYYLTIELSDWLYFAGSWVLILLLSRRKRKLLQKSKTNWHFHIWRGQPWRLIPPSHRVDPIWLSFATRFNLDNYQW